MAKYFVGIGGNDGNNGLTWANRKATWNGAEDIPVAAGDFVCIGPGVYREQLTVDVSGAAGSPITYYADTTGAETDGIGGIVRITGSDDDMTATRANCIASANRDYRTFRGFAFDTTTNNHLIVNNNGDTWIIEDCTFQAGVAAGASVAGVGIQSTALANTIRRCTFYVLGAASQGILFTHTADVDNTGHVVENCVIVGGPNNGAGIQTANIGGITIRDCTIWGNRFGIYVSAALTVGQTVTVNGCTLASQVYGFYGTAVTEIIENHNNVWGCTTARTNTNVGPNSLAYPPLFDLGILHAGAGQVSGFRLPQPQFGALSQWSQVRAIADGGTNATLDITGLTRPVTDGKRSWGAVQYQNVGREATTVHGGSLAQRFDDYGRRQYWIPYPGDQVQITVSVWGYYEADYAGALPCMIIKQPGQADRVTSMVGGSGAWEELTDTFTPNHRPDWICVELCSLNTDAANPATNDVFFDDLTVVAIGSLGDMETWLWDTEVSDWVAYAGGGGACDYPAEEDVENGVVYGSGAYTGTLVCGKRCARFPDMELCKRRGLP